MRKITMPLLLLSIVIISFVLWKSSQQKVLEIPYPYIFKSETIPNKYCCETSVGTDLDAAVQYVGGIKYDVRGKVFKATDKLSIEFKDDKLYCLTKASFEAGDSRDENPFNIIYNDEHKVLAIDEIDANLIVNVFTLNKDTGIGNWAKIRADGFLTGNPDSQSYCLKCWPQ